MRYILIILLFLSVGANAQMVIKAHANYRPLVQPAANLLLDDYPNAAAAYSLRKLDKDYTGAAIRVRKDTTGQPEQDIGFTASGDLDTAALKSFLNARSGFVTTWYDQSGNARNATNAVSNEQPSIANLGVLIREDNKICVRFSGSNHLNFTALSSNTNFSIYLIQKRTSSSNIGIMFAGDAVGLGNENFVQWNDNNFYIQFNKSGQYVYQFASDNTTGLNLLSAYNNSGTITAYRNNTQYSLSSQINMTSTFTGFNSIGRYNGGNAFFRSNGFAYEVIYYQSNQSSNRTGIQNNINDYYNLYWNGDFTGLLDTYPNSAAAYSLRNLSSTYTGPLIRVRKDTTGQPEMDVYGDYFGNLDTVGLKNFLLTRSGFVTTWYDQSGNARNASQATQANQPRIALNGLIDRRSGDLAIVYDGTNDYLDNNSNGFSVNNVSHYAVSSRGNDANALRTIYSTGILAGLNGFGFFYVLDDAPVAQRNNIFQQIRNVDTSVQSIGNYTNTINTNNLIFGIGTSTTDYTYYNGGDEKTVTHTRSNVTSNGRIVIGSRISETSEYLWFLNGTTTEIVFWNANQSSNRSAITSNINTHYGIY